MQNKLAAKLAYFLGAKAPRWLFYLAFAVRIVQKKVLMHQVKRRFGTLNPDKTFYVIRLFPPAAGFLANYNYVLGYMKHAYDNGWIPVVDMENYSTFYQQDMPVNGTRNVWEYYFEQPLDAPDGEKRYSLSEVYKSKNVILSDGSMQYCSFAGDAETLCWQSEMARLAPFNSEMLAYIAAVCRELQLPEETDIIGIPCRGSALSKRFIGHHVQATADELIETAKVKTVEWKTDRSIALFVNAEEAQPITAFLDAFPNVYHVANKPLPDIKEGASVSSSTFSYLQIADYLTNIYLISQCSSIIGSMNNGFYTALIWNGGKYQHVEHIDKGCYR